MEERTARESCTRSYMYSTTFKVVGKKSAWEKTVRSTERADQFELSLIKVFCVVSATAREDKTVYTSVFAELYL